MKTKNIIYKAATKTTVVFCALALVFLAGCKKDFQVPAHSSIDAAVLWNDEGSVQYHLNGTYQVIMPDYPYEVAALLQEFASDENIGSATDGTLKAIMGIGTVLTSNDVKIIGSKYQGSNKGDNRYFDIARCNDGIGNLPTSTMPAATQKKLIGQYYMLRAMAYFDLVRLYGGVPLILRTQSPSNFETVPRSNAQACFTQIVKDLDSAAVNLNGVTYADASERGKLTKLAAVCYKAKVLLYWASPQFNPVGDPAHPYKDERWADALVANKAAYDLCQTSGISLMPDYSTIFQTEGTGNTEAIMVRSYSTSIEKRGNNVESKVRPAGATFTGGTGSDYYVATQRMLDAYTMADGTPISQAGAAYDSFMYWKNRDPRFAQTIAYNGSNWKLNGTAARKQWTYNGEIEGSTKPFYCKRFSDPNLAAASVAIVADKGGNGFDWIELRYAEVLLNYAECLNETGDLVTAKNMVRLIRQRAKVLIGTKDYGLDYATDKASMRTLIANERMVEFAFEGKRGWDLRRTRKFHELSGFLTVAGESISTVPNVPATPTKKDQLETLDANGIRGRDKIDMSIATTYINYFTRNLIYGNNTQAISISASQCYFYGLPNSFLLSSPLLDQTLGWDNGTFDPLK
ncbi:RagB/SusD family nutrient uptake outer membrane protein [Mucilaginibacter sp. HMF5004]|uniref:RagB/SusD family nutrient uptake outer membrane protein n=1 Tax=Mucilaginibacter rivuli TaxID=2857527 RepID=UPI001C5D42BD|nr:RagB/SusD family nutrient uptake outer membrane protein [Mucilaginibacter rivuli]MBW4889019.1 RagB/SusD family nutrient uptake outer membrane protein [Mucilaginibacter rivuli]